MPTKVVIASILKPVTDTRMLEKMAQSLSLESKYSTFIIGQDAKASEHPDNITLLPIFSFPRLSLKRIWAHWKFLFCLVKIRPQIIIVNTYELLKAASFYKIIFGCRLIYDIRENYHLNVAQGSSYPRISRAMIAFLIKKFESFFSVWVDHFFIAERSYKDELPFIGKDYTLLENKVAQSVTDNISITRDPGGFRFLICGTLSIEYGVLEGIDFFLRIAGKLQGARLTLMGYCPNSKTRKHLLKKIEGIDSINLIGGNQPVPHEMILEEMGKANYLLLPYRNLPQIINCFPTKIYEAAALKCPVIISPFGIWKQFVEDNSAGLLFNFQSSDPEEIINQLSSNSFYTSEFEASIYWESYQENFLNSLQKPA